MRFKLPRLGTAAPSDVPHPSARGAREWTARLAAFASMVGLMLAVAWPAPATGQDQPPPELQGSFTVTIGKDDLPPGLAGGPALIGLWTLTFNPDGTYVVARQDVGTLASGTYTVSGATLTFNDWQGILACGAASGAANAAEGAEATYAWRVEGDVLTLTPIQETCAERRILFTTRSLGGYEPCATEPLAALLPGGGFDDRQAPAATPVSEPQATPLATPGVAVQEGLAEQPGVPPGGPEEAIDALLRQATGCWATGDPARFLPLHSQRVIDELEQFAPLPEVANDLRMLMATPVSFERIGVVEMTDPTHAVAYVEVTFGGEEIPQRFDFVYENGVWLFDSFFLFGPADGPPPVP